MVTERQEILASLSEKSVLTISELNQAYIDLWWKLYGRMLRYWKQLQPARKIST
jgi:hypothetical protein